MMGTRKKHKLRVAGVMVALGMSTLFGSTFLSEGTLRWVCLAVAFVFIILGIVFVTRASGEPDY